MQTSQFSFKKSLWVLLPLTITIFSLWGISSCTGEKDKEEEKDNLGATCMTVTKDQIIKYWVDKYTKPGNPAEQIITGLKFYSAYDPVGGGFKVSVIAVNKFGTRLGDQFDLSTGVACGVNLPPLYIARSNDIDLSTLNILKPDGTLVDNFVKIILTPAAYDIDGLMFLKYVVSVVIGDTTAEMGSGLPCPPCINCRPACPDWCEPACAEDSLVSSTHLLLNNPLTASIDRE